MYLFIFESIGTQELILIGVIALIFLGPRRLPEYARKIGKVMAEFRGTAHEFRETWEREVNFEEEAAALKLDSIEEEAEKPAAREPSAAAPAIAPPAIRQVDPASFTAPPTDEKTAEAANPAPAEPDEDIHDQHLEKHNWL